MMMRMDGEVQETTTEMALLKYMHVGTENGKADCKALSFLV